MWKRDATLSLSDLDEKQAVMTTGVSAASRRAESPMRIRVRERGGEEEE